MKTRTLFNKKWHCSYRSLAVVMGLLGWAMLLQYRNFIQPFFTFFFFWQCEPDNWSVVTAFQFLRTMWIWFSKTPSSHLQAKPLWGNGGEQKPCQHVYGSEWGRLPGRGAMPDYSSALRLHFDHVHICSVRACEINMFPSLSFHTVWSLSFMVGCLSAIVILLVKKKKMNWEMISFNMSC